MNKPLCHTIQACMHPENGIIIKKKGVFEAKERPASFRRWYGILFNSNLYACSGASPLWVRSLWRCSTALDAYSLSAPTKNEGTLLLDRMFAVWCLMCFKAYFTLCLSTNLLNLQTLQSIITVTQILLRLWTIHIFEQNAPWCLRP